MSKFKPLFSSHRLKVFPLKYRVYAVLNLSRLSLLCLLTNKRGGDSYENSIENDKYRTGDYSWEFYDYNFGNTPEKADLNWSGITKLRVAGTRLYTLVFVDDIVYQTENSLHVELSSWIANSKSGLVNLHWTTDSEIENLGFIIERTNEGSHWEELASFSDNDLLRGQGSTTRSNDYTYVDKDVRVGQEYSYRLSDVDYNGKVTTHATITVLVKAKDETVLAESFMLHSAFPNPFNPSTTIRYELGSSSPLEIMIYDIRGQVVWSDKFSEQSAGQYDLQWDGINMDGEFLPGGVYLISMKTPAYQTAQKVILTK